MLRTSARWLSVVVLVALAGCSSEGDEEQDAAAPTSPDGGGGGPPSRDAAAGDAAPMAPRDAASADTSPGEDAAPLVPDASVDASVDAPAPDASPPQADAAPPDAAEETCASSCPFGLCAGSACAVEKVAGTSGAPWDVAVSGNAVFWTTGSAIAGCSNGVCTNLVNAPSGHTYLALAIGRADDTDWVFTTDNNYGQGLWRTNPAGTAHTNWGSVAGNAAAIASFGNVVIFGNASGVYRASTTAAGATKVMTPAPAFIPGASAQSPPLHNVAVDDTTMFTASLVDVYKCPVGGTCVDNLIPAASQTMGNVVAMTIYDGVLYAIGGTPMVVGGTERLWSVPVSGGNRSDLATVMPAKAGGGAPYGLLADERRLYFGSLDGNLYACPRTSCTNATILVPDARPYGMAQTSTHVYWSDHTRGAIYRLRKP